MDDILHYIDQHADEYIERIRKLCQQPSVAAQNLGMTETATMVQSMLADLGARVQLVPTSGFPVVYGEITGNGRKTLSFYDHYDVQPPEPLDLWKSPPFAAEVRDGRIFARGVSDNKGNLVARLCAVDAWQKVRGSVPLNLKFIFEGEEEIGSPHLDEFAHAHPDLLRADGCVWEAGYKDVQGRLEIHLGVKGILYVELRATGANSDLHSANAAIVPAPAWRLLWALASLKNSKERVTIPGFYDTVKAPTLAEKKILADWEYDEAGQKRQLGLDHFLLNLEGQALKERFIYQPTCNICGVWGGYSGPGLKTVLPREAAAKVDFRLVPDQDPLDIFKKLRAHLDQQGFSDVEVKVLASEHPAKTDPTDPLPRAVVNAAKKIYQQSPVVSPMAPGSGPQYILCQRQGIPAAGSGVGNAESRNHAPNENIVVADYIEGIKHIAMVIEEFSRA